MKNIKKIVSFVLVVIMIMPTILVAMPIISHASGMNLGQLKAKFPHGMYWNHYVNNRYESSNYLRDQGYDGFVDSVSAYACWSHSASGYDNYVGHYDCNRFNGATQCAGFAKRLAYWAYNGSDVNLWSKDYSTANIKPGDVLQYSDQYTDPTWGHTVFVIGVSGSTITVGECNWGGNCIIKWGRTINKNNITVKEHRIAPYALDTSENNYANLGDDFYAYIIQQSDWKHLEASNGNVQIASNGNDSYDPKQIWHFIRTTEDNQYKIINEYNGQCLDASNFGTVNGTNVGVCESNDTTAQRWHIDKGPTGAFTISPSYATNLVLDCTNGYTDPGSNIQLYASNNTSAQEFNIYNISGDGWEYDNPTVPPASSVTSVSYDSMLQIATINWSNSPLIGKIDNRVYDIRIWKGTDTSVDPCYGKMSISGTQHKVNLSEGTYTINIATVNTRYYQCYTMGSNITCTLNTNHATNNIHLWACGFKNNEGNSGSGHARLLGTKSFNKYYGDKFVLSEKDCPVNIPNGFYLATTIGSYYDSSEWNRFDFGTTFTQPNKEVIFEYDCYPIDYSITYNLNGGINSANNPSTYNVLYGVTLEDPVREGYNFAGWTDVDGNYVTGINSGANANHSSAEELYSILNTRTIGNQILTANWTHICADGHLWTDWTETKAPTCTALGMSERTCSRCGASETTDIPALEHIPGEAIVTVAATCISEGTRVICCDLCGDKLSEETIPALGHDWGEWQFLNESTITEIGTLIRHCKNCESNKTKEDIVAEGICGANIKWYINSIGALFLTGDGETYSYSNDESPWGEYQDKIKYVTVDEGISNLGSFLFFGCDNLERAYISDSVEGFGTYVFDYSGDFSIYCSISSKAIRYAMERSFKYVITDELVDLQIIRTPFRTVYPLNGTLLTYGLKLKVVNEFGDEAEFNEGYSIEEYDFSTEGEKIITVVFNGISETFVVNVDASLENKTYIATGVYPSNDVCWLLDENGTLEICGEGEVAPLYKPWQLYTDSIKRIVINRGVTGIGAVSFNSITYLESVEMSDTVMYIYSSAFSNNSNLKTILIPKSVVRIDPNVFTGSTGVTIHCFENSLAHSYAIENSIHYELITNIPAISVNNYNITITGSDYIKDMRYALGEYTTTTEIRNAEGNVAISNTLVQKYTVDGNFVYEMPKGGYYTIWIRMQDGTSYILPLDVTNFTPTVTANGVTVTIHDLYDVKDFYIAKGEYTTYREIKDNGYIFSATAEKIAGKHDYTHVVYEPGVHTILIRYNDGTQDVFHETLTVDEPVFTENGLQLIISNIPDVRVIRTAYGVYENASQVKRAEGARNFSAKSTIQGKDPYTIQYREEGMITVTVEYMNGYQAVYHYNVQKKTPVFEQDENKVTFGDLDGFVMVRYARGEYETISQIKAAKGSKALKADAVIDGNITVTLDPGTYTFCVQYDDESYNYYTVIVE